MTTSLAPFVPSQHTIVQRMLEIGQVDSNDVLFDLGCGDGRILIMAVKDFGAKKAVGYEMRKDLYENVLQEVKKQQLEDRIKVVNDDLLKADISEATIITLYLTTSGNDKLKPKLSGEAKAGTRVVSHDFDFNGWSYLKKEGFSGHTIYLYKLPDAFKEEKGKEPRSIFSFRGRRIF